MSEIKERPIIFNSKMVRAILDGKKTQTRRVIKPQPQYPGLQNMIYIKHPFAPSSVKGTPAESVINVPEEYIWCHEDWVGNIVGEQGKCPYGVPGDRLWVRETFTEILTKPFDSTSTKIVYKADGWTPNDPKYPIKWKPSIHMPRWASRITLEVLDVRVQRVQNILDAEAIAEGINPKEVAIRGWVDARVGFRQLWDSINAKRGYSWVSNPWVWVVEYKVINE